MDFKAAFPKTSQQFLEKSLEELGMPLCTRNFIKNLYSGHRCCISFGGRSYTGFDLTSGIRQGCPLSPILFSLIIDIFLRRVQRLLPDASIHAFADDVGIVVQEYR